MEEAKQDINDISEKKSFVAWAKMHKRAWGDEVPHAPRIQREHGWYLPNDD